MTYLTRYGHLIIAFVFFIVLFFCLLFTHMLQPKVDGLYSAGNTWGDLAIHMDYASSFRERGLVTIFDNPIYAGEKLSYPFIPDLISGFLSKVLPLNVSFILPSFIVLSSAVALVLLLSYKITGSKTASALVPFLFFFNGSVSGLYYALTDLLNGMSISSVLNNDYAHIIDKNIHFSNLIADYILPQRTFIFGLLLGVASLIFLWRYWNTKEFKKLLIGIIFCGLTPLFHTHTFITLSMFLAGLFLLDIRNYRTWFKGFLLLCLLVLPQIFLLYKGSHNNFVHWKPGWMVAREGVIVFWVKNLGLYVPLFFLSLYKTTTKQRTFFLPLIVIFILANLFQFQPHIYDNMKLMIWWFLFLCIFTANYLVKLPRILALSTFLLLIGTGLLTTYRELNLSWIMFSNEEIALANYIRYNTPPNALFLTSDRHNNPVNCLAGRKVYLGFRGWLWTHGISYANREKKWVEIYRGDPEARSYIKEDDLDYILLEKYKYNELNIKEEFFYENYILRYKSDSFLLFQAT